MPEARHIARPGGDFDIILMVCAIDNIDLWRMIFYLQSIPGAADTQTFLVLEDVWVR